MAFTIKKLSKKLKVFTLNISGLTLQKGEIVGLLGQNGSGKSTFIKSIVGEILCDAKDIEWNDSATYLEQVSYISDSIKYNKLTVSEYGVIYGSIYKTWNQDQFNLDLNNYGLNSEQDVDTLSLGEQQKLMFAVSKAYNASIYIFDEPSDGYDSFSFNIFKNDLLSLANDDNLFLVATHQIKGYENILDRILYMFNGEILFNHTVLEIETNGESILMELNAMKADIESYLTNPSLDAFLIAVERRDRHVFI